MKIWGSRALAGLARTWSAKVWADVICDGPLEDLFGEEGFVVVGEFAQVFLAEPAGSHGLEVAGEPFGANAGAVGGGDLDAVPGGSAVGPGFEEEAAAAEGGADEPEIAVAGGEDGAHGEIEVFRDAGGFIDEEHAGAGEAAYVGFGAGEADDAGAVGEAEGDLVDAVTFGAEAEAAEEQGGFVDEFAGLAGGGADDEDEAFGVVPGGEDGAGGGDGGLSPLAGAV